MKTDENIIDENINLQTDGLTDLPATEQQAEETKGGKQQVTWTYMVTNTSPTT